MNPGKSVPDADMSCRPGQDDADEPGAVASHAGTAARSLVTDRALQDIQDIIDKLAALTQQLRR